MTHMSVDIETYSDVGLKSAGLYKYAQSPNFEVLLIAYAIDGGPVTVIDVTKVAPNGEEVMAFWRYLRAPDVLVHAYNAAFEWFCLSVWFGRAGDKSSALELLSRMRCTMAHGLYCGYPAGLAAVGEALNLPQDKRKMGVGYGLIRTFCVPQKPTKTNGGRTRVLPCHEPEKWEVFKSYCAQDVETERTVERMLSAYPMPEREQRLWELDMLMNAHGVAVDAPLTTGALAISEATTKRLMDEARAISGLDNPKSVAQLLKWLNDEIKADDEAEQGEETQALADLRKETVAQLLASGATNDRVTRMLELRQQLGKTSTKKFDAVARAVGADGRVRGLLQYYGANRTGRWAGRLVQVQNLPRNHLDTLDFARELTRAGRGDDLWMCYGDVPDTLSQLVRTVFVPSPGNKLVVADYSAIEARVISWLAGETWRQDVFKTHGKIYEASASAMFGVPIDRIKKGNPEYELRQKGKVAELALGYQGGKGALIKMGAIKMGLKEDELPEIVMRWRQASPNIVRLWHQLEESAKTTITTGEPVGTHGLVFMRAEEFLLISLPSTRRLFYARPRIGENRFGSNAIIYKGVNQVRKKWGELETYGGKLVENVVQAIARDCLAELLLRLEGRISGRVVFHVHDEVIIDSPEPDRDFAVALEEMARPIEWAPGLCLKGDGFTADYYRKD